MNMIQRETENIEFKKSTSELKEAVISLSSMLNKSGHGIVFFGVKNDGTVCGQEVGEYTTTRIAEEIKHNIKPFVSAKIEVVSEDDKSVIRIEAYGEDTPYSAYGRYYRRCSDQDLQMTQKELEHCFESKNFSYSGWEKELTTFGEEDVDENLLINYVDKANELNRLDYRYVSVPVTMTRLGLMEGGKLNNAGLYLFSRTKPLIVKFARFANDDRTIFIDNRQFRGNIFECIDESVRYIMSSLNINAVIRGLQRVEQLEIPVEAFREIVINSFAHMRVIDGDYHEITITPNRVRIYNPGTIALNEKPESFASGDIGSKLRNPLIAMTLYRNKTIEAFGTGFKRVFDICQRENIPYSYRTEGLGFSFTFTRGMTSLLTEKEASAEQNIQPSTLKLSSTAAKVYRLLKEDNTITTISEISEKLGKSHSTIQKALSSLVDLHLIERNGSKKKGLWKVINVQTTVFKI